jgi:proline iminopeptidase
MLEQVYTRHLCRLNPTPEPVTRAFRNLNEKVYHYIQGANEFIVTGTMKNWERWTDLPRIRTKTLVLGAK